MRRLLGPTWILTLGSLLLLADAAHGLGLLADDRRVDSLVPDFFFAPFYVALPGAGQTSSISLSADGLGFDGSASGTANGPGGAVSGESIFSIGFRIDGDGALDLHVDSLFYDMASASVRVLAGSAVLFDAQPGGPSEFATALMPGAYTLEARAKTTGFDESAFFNLTFHVRDTAVPVPEPGTALLLGSGVAGLVLFGPTKRG
jgi:hypothetical protein